MVYKCQFARMQSMLFASNVLISNLKKVKATSMEYCGPFY